MIAACGGRSGSGRRVRRRGGQALGGRGGVTESRDRPREDSSACGGWGSRIMGRKESWKGATGHQGLGEKRQWKYHGSRRSC